MIQPATLRASVQHSMTKESNGLSEHSFSRLLFGYFFAKRTRSNVGVALVLSRAKYDEISVCFL